MNKALVFGIVFLTLLQFHQWIIQPDGGEFKYRFFKETEPPPRIEKIYNYIFSKNIEPETANNITMTIFNIEYDYGIQASLIMAIIETESGWNSLAVSRTGDKGLMQICMRVWYNYLLSNGFLEDENGIFDEVTNINIGVHIFQKNLVSHNNNIRLALFSYLGDSQEWYYQRVIKNQIRIERTLQ